MSTDTEKSPDAFRTITEVSRWLDTPAHVLRFWESRFPEVAPVKRAGGRRYYRPEDMQILGGIKTMLHDRGQSIRDVQEVLAEEGVDGIVALSPDFDFSTPPDPEDGPPVHRFTLSAGAEDTPPTLQFEPAAAEPAHDAADAPWPEPPLAEHDAEAAAIEADAATPPRAPESHTDWDQASDVEDPDDTAGPFESGPEADLFGPETDAASPPSMDAPQPELFSHQDTAPASEAESDEAPSGFRTRRSRSRSESEQRTRDGGQIRGFFFTDLGEPGLDEDDPRDHDSDDHDTFASFAALQDAAAEAIETLDDAYDDPAFDPEAPVEVVDLAAEAEQWSDLAAAPVELLSEPDLLEASEEDSPGITDPAALIRIAPQRSLLPKDPPHLDPDRPMAPRQTADLRCLTAIELRSALGPELDALAARLTALRDRMTAA